MFEFAKGILYVRAPKEVVLKLRNLADLEKGLQTAKFHSLEVTNPDGKHHGVGFYCDDHAVAMYFEEPPAQKVEEPNEPEKAE